MFDDFYQVVITELWLRSKSGLPESNVELVKIARAAIRRCWRDYTDSAETFAIEAFREKNEWGDFEIAEEDDILPEEGIQRWARSGPFSTMQVRQALRKLSPYHHNILRFRFYYGKNREEAASNIGVPPRSIYQAERRALLKLCEILALDSRPLAEEGENTKVCRSCGQEKDFDAFRVSECYQDGRSNQCKDCERAESQERVERKRKDKLAVLLAQHHADSTKPCELCGEDRPLAEYRPDGRYRKGQFPGFDVLRKPCRLTRPTAALRETSVADKKRREKRGKRFCANGGRCVMVPFNGKPMELLITYPEEECPMCYSATD